MIHFVEGDILLSGANVLVHGVGPGDHFASGLALALRNQWPGMYKDFRHYGQTTSPKAGSLWSWMGADGKHVVALYTQDKGANESSHPEKATLSNVRHCLQALRTLIDAEKFKSVAIPRLATGVGGLSWDEVAPLVEKYLGDVPAQIFVYKTYHQNMKANEPKE